MLTLLTDFGLDDSYIGIMKGVIHSIAPQTPIIDLTHTIPPQDLWAARFNLLNAVPYFAQGTIHVAVVDPGVGSDRRAVAIQLPHCTLVGPDNGIFSGVFGSYLAQGEWESGGVGEWESRGVRAIALTNSNYWRTANPSTTFHGRDIFAPVAAHLARGIPLAELGDEIDPGSLKRLDLPEVQQQGNQLVGCIQYGDRFGNLITNIAGTKVTNRAWTIAIGAQQLQGQRTYADAVLGQPVALVGSHSWVEIAVNGGSAARYFGIDRGQLGVGQSVTITLN